MAITGIESAVYGVADLDLCTRYFSDFGLPLERRTQAESVFRLDEGCRVVLRPQDDATLAAPWYGPEGVRETIWGVDTPEALERLAAELAVDREVRRDADGTARFRADDGMPLGLRLFQPRPILGVSDPVNGPGAARRVNQHRVWRKRARPKKIAHVVFQVPDPQASFAFFRDRLQFRLSDSQQDFGYYARADGSNEHHNIFWLNCNTIHAPPGFNHAAFVCDDLDEMMVGVNFLKRHGWETKARGELVGLGRHRIASSLFYYLPCPAGGNAEYVADGDCLDDSWIPRHWNAAFGAASWFHDIPPRLSEEPDWSVTFVEE